MYEFGTYYVEGEPVEVEIVFRLSASDWERLENSPQWQAVDRFIANPQRKSIKGTIRK